MIKILFAGAPRGCQTAPTIYISLSLGGAEMLCAPAGAAGNNLKNSFPPYSLPRALEW